MTYLRVIPRDLFNEGNLLKCYGQLYLNLEKMGFDQMLVHSYDDQPFMVEQDPSDGSLSVRNIELRIRGANYRFKRPLNARRSYPLYLVADEEDIAVFEDDGSFTGEMKVFLKPATPAA